MKDLRLLFLILSIAALTSGCGPKWTETEKGAYNLVTNQGGETLGYSPSSGVNILTIDRLGFKDLNQNGSLDPYEDWRLSSEDRAKDLASRMSIEQIAGLMLYSSHQGIPGSRGATFGGKPFDESGANPSDLSDQQITFFTDDNLRHVLLTRVQSPEIAAIWNNHAQALVEGLGLGIPSNNSSDPRHEADADQEYTLGAGGDISRWPGGIGLSATFDPELVRRFGEIASIEYRALGISTALSPQIDLATDPRWSRFKGTFGGEPELVTDMARAYIDGFQTSSESAEINSGWGYESVNAMAKHWPGGGSGEAGRDAHYAYGKYAVYPGNKFDEHLKPFINGAFALEGGTRMASAIMPYYTISMDQDPSGENVGNAYNKYLITDLLRDKYNYDGVVCTDWGITRDEGEMHQFSGKSWGVENLSVEERHYKILMAGCDQFGGNNDAKPVIAAYEMGVAEHGEEFMRSRFELSAVRLLKNIFRVGLFENPYLDVEETKEIVGNPDFMKEGYEAQQKSVILLKNKESVLPLTEKTKVYVPQRFFPEARGYFGISSEAGFRDAISPEVVSGYFTPTNDPADAEVAIVVINSPEMPGLAGYSQQDAAAGGNGFVPITLQYDTYTATDARETSLAGDSRPGDVLNRTYQSKSITPANQADLDLIQKTKAEMNGKPVIVILRLENPTVVAEFESEIDALVISFEVQDQVILDILSGKVEPSGLLPLQMPASMSVVEQQYEDAPMDMKAYVDSEGNAYDFAFGLNWAGQIQDRRTEKYARK